jgi:hypothetical protein
MFGFDDIALLGASALGGIFGNRNKKQTSTTSTTLSPDAQGMNSVIADLIRKRLSSSTDLSGYKTQGIQDINKTFGAAQTGLNADLTARGLSDSPAAVGALTNLSTGRSGSIAQLVNSLPMLQRDMQQQDIGLANQFSALQPRTTTTTGTGSGNMAGGAFSDIASMLGYLIGSGKFGAQQQKNPAGVGSPALNWSLGAHV